MKEQDIVEVLGKEYYVLSKSSQYVLLTPLSLEQQAVGIVYRIQNDKIYELETEEEKRNAIKWLESLLKNGNQE